MLRIFLPWIIMAVVAGGGMVWADQRCNSACKRERTEKQAVVDELAVEKRARVIADRRADSLSLAYTTLAKRGQDQLKLAEETHNVRLARLDVQIKALRARNASLSSDLLRVWGRASETANQAASDGAAAQGSDGPPAALPDAPQTGTIVAVNELDMAVFVKDAAAAYGSCTIKLRTCISTYNDARDAQIRSNDGS